MILSSQNQNIKVRSKQIYGLNLPPIILIHVALGVLLGLALPITVSLSSQTYYSNILFPHEPFHSVLEGLGGFISLAMAGFLLLTWRGESKNIHFLPLSYALIAMGLLDIFHASVSHKNLFVWLHSSAQFIGGLFFSLVWVANLNGTKLWSFRKVVLVALGATFFGLMSLVFPEEVPKMVEEEEFTFFARALNILGGLGFYIAAIFFIERYKNYSHRDDYFFFVFCLLLGSAGVLFELSNLWDPAWWWWHALRVFAYFTGLYLIIHTYIFTTKSKQESEIANRAKSVFLANMSHELRTPLNAILGFSQILLRDNTLSSEEKEGLSFIHDSGNHLLVLINDILDLSKIEVGKIEINPHSLRLKPFMQTIDSIMREQASAKDLSFILTEEPDLPEVIEADEFRLRQVLFNLINNAIKFTTSGEVRFAVSVTDKQDPANQTLRFEVTDTGTGIAKEDLETIFHPFERAGDFSKREEGSGLGLSISGKLVALMGGELQVVSEPGKGSRFWFEVTFPVHKEARFHKEAPQEIMLEREVTGYKGKRLTALVADDKPANLVLLKKMLINIGFKVLTATDGRQEVDMAIKVKPDIILTDLKMPVMDGNSAARAIRKIKELADTPIIAVSAGVMEMQKEESIQAGCNDFLEKPIQFPALLNVLQKALALEWSYEKIEEEETFTPSPKLNLPPLDVIKRLLQAAEIGSITMLKKELSKIRETDSKYQPFADKLEKLSDEFHMNQIVKFLKPYCEK